MKQKQKKKSLYHKIESPDKLIPEAEACTPSPPPSWTWQTWHSPRPPPLTATHPSSPPPTRDPNIAINTAAFGVRMPPSCWCLSMRPNWMVQFVNVKPSPPPQPPAGLASTRLSQIRFTSRASGPAVLYCQADPGDSHAAATWGHQICDEAEPQGNLHGCRCIYIIFYP